MFYSKNPFITKLIFSRTKYILNNSFQARPVTILMLRMQPLLRNINQRIQNQPGRGSVQINNEDTICRLTNLPQQPITNNPFIDSFFQGTSF
jgi:hypothetical protein